MARALVTILAVGTAFASLSYTGGMFHRRGGGESRSGAVAPASRVEPDRVTTLGRLEPHGGVLAIAGPPGARIARIEVREGQDVRRGEALVELEGRAELLAEKAHLEAQVREAQGRLDAERRYVGVLEDEVTLERRRVEELEPREIQSRRAKLDLLRANLKNSTSNLNRFEELAKHAAVSQQDYDQARLLVRRDQEELESARILLDQLEEEHELHRERVALEARKAEAGSIRLQRAIPIESSRAGVELVDAKLEQLAIKAPRDGRVLKLMAHPGEAAGGRPLLQLGDVATMDVVAEVYETDRKRVREGQRAGVTSPALPEGTPILHGVVERIGWTIAKNDVLGLDPAADAYARVVEVRIRLDPDESRAVAHLTNLQVDVTIEAAEVVARTAGPGPGSGPERRR